MGELYTVIVNGIQFPQIAFGGIKHNSHLGKIVYRYKNGIQYPQAIGGIVYRYSQRYTISPIGILWNKAYQSFGEIVYRYGQRYTIPPGNWGNCISL